MAYTLNRYFQATFSNPSATRVIVYPNNTVAAQILKRHIEQGSEVVKAAECLFENETQLPMPNALMRVIDTRIGSISGRASVVGLDAYLALLDAESVTVFMSELRDRLDTNSLNADFLLSTGSRVDFAPRYEEARRVIRIEGNEEENEPLNIRAYSDKWVKNDGIKGYKTLLGQLNQYIPSGSYTLIITELTEAQAGIGNAVSFVLNIRDIATKYYKIDADLDDATLEFLLAKLSESGQSAEVYLTNQFRTENCDIRLALKRLLELTPDGLWMAYIWLLRRRLPSGSYIAKILSSDVTRDNLLWKYVVDAAVTLLSDTNAKKYAVERAEALNAISLNYESLILEFIGITKDNGDALQFLNCGTNSERIEIVRRASMEDLSFGLPKQYGELFPILADYFSNAFDYGDEEVMAYFKEYRRLKVSNSITDSFVKRAFEITVPQTYLTRDAVLNELRAQSDTALLVVDAMGVEYMPLLLVMAKRNGMNIESYTVVTAKLPTETDFNPIMWDEPRELPGVRSVDSIVHNGAAEHETCTPERSFSETLRVFETEVMKRIADGLTHFSRVVVTADHGATRLAVITHNENMGMTLPWDTARYGQPDNWRYSLAPQSVAKPQEFESEYFPDRKETYWIVRGYNRLPKKGGKLYELHGGATLEERLVPVVVFSKNAVTIVPKQLDKKAVVEVADEFEGLI